MRSLLLSLSLLSVTITNSQVLIDDKSGDPISNNFSQLNATGNLSLIRLSTGSQSLGFSHFISTALKDPSNYQIYEFGIKVKPTDGFGALVSNGQFSPGIRLAFSFTKITLFSGTSHSNYLDWGGVSATFDTDQYTLVKKDTTFASQVYTKKFNGLGLTLQYNALINSKWILHFRSGYGRQNNLDDLTSVDVNDILFTSTNPNSSAQREVVKTKSAKDGIYEEFDAFPLLLSFTKATKTDPAGSPEAAKLRFGWSIFCRNSMSKALPKSTLGFILFLTRQDKNGIRTPILGLSFQAKDPFDVLGKGNGLQNRIGVGFTTSFTL